MDLFQNINFIIFFFSPHRISFYERVFLKSIKNQKSEFEELKVPSWMTSLSEPSNVDLKKTPSKFYLVFKKFI